MEFETGRPRSGRMIDTDICVIGAGPAGLVLAATLAARGREVVVLESGGAANDASFQGLSVGDTTGDAYAGLRATRHRQLGGSASLWNTPTLGELGAKYVPLDAWDLQPRWPDAQDGWPIDYAELHAYYRRAQQVAGLGPFAYDAEAWRTSGPAPIALGGGVTSRVYQLGSRDALLQPLLAQLRGSPNARLYTQATVVQLTEMPARTSVIVAEPWGDRWTVAARRVVLAAGAVENARLLLVAQDRGGRVRDRSSWLGHGFMEHPRDRAITMTATGRETYASLGFYDLHRGTDGTPLLGRLALDAGVMQEGGQLNASATLLPRLDPRRARLRRALGRVGRLRALQRWLPADGHGWSRHPAPDDVFRGFTILLNVEQPPHHDNAIRLSSRRDINGVPLPALHWRWHASDHARLEELRARVARALEGGGFGRVTVDVDARPDPNARHHAGTTRMHRDPSRGVVDADGRVHGCETLFVAGASTFPTAGFANPTLTIVALALRLADLLESGA